MPYVVSTFPRVTDHSYAWEYCSARKAPVAASAGFTEGFRGPHGMKSVQVAHRDIQGSLTGSGRQPKPARIAPMTVAVWVAADLVTRRRQSCLGELGSCKAPQPGPIVAARRLGGYTIRCPIATSRAVSLAPY